VSTLDGPALVWLALAIVAAIVEVSVPHFGLVFVAFGAVAAAAAAFFSLGATGQVLVFAITAGASLAVLRPTLMSRLGARGVPSRTEALIGREGIVTQDIETTVGAGRVNVRGEDWAARAPVPVAAGTRVRVVGADGIVLEVRPV
jgi:membrane protein implicated in regulation of membrane protease activity